MKSLSEIPAKLVWLYQHRAILRLHLFTIGETHQMLADFADKAKSIILNAANDEGKIDGLGLMKTLGALDRAWGRFSKDWQQLFERMRNEAASIPFGVLAVMHRDASRVLANSGLGESSGYGHSERLLEEAEGKNTLDYLFNPQLRAITDAANQRIYSDGLRLSQRIWQLDQESLQGIKNVLYEGAASGASAWDIAKQLEAFLGPGRECPRWTSTRLYKLTKAQIASGVSTGLKTGVECQGQGVSYNALRLARTEIQAVHGMATDAIMGRIPWIEKEQINLSSGHAEHDICDETIAAGENGAGIYAKGSIVLPLHPNCLCYKTSVLMKPDEFTSQLRGWTDGTQAWPAMDQYAAGLGGNVNVDLTGTLIAQALARWATGNREELLRVVQ